MNVAARGLGIAQSALENADLILAAEDARRRSRVAVEHQLGGLDALVTELVFDGYRSPAAEGTLEAGTELVEHQLGYKGVESTELVFDGYRVPASSILGGEDQVGHELLEPDAATLRREDAEAGHRQPSNTSSVDSTPL